MKHIKKTKGVSKALVLCVHPPDIYPLEYLVRGMVPSPMGVVSTHSRDIRDVQQFVFRIYDCG